MDEQEKLKQHEQRRTQLEAKTTEELESIWRKQNHDVWTDDGLEAVREILLDRTGTFPDVDDDHMEIEEIPDTYHKRSTVLSIASWARTFSIVALSGVILSGIGLAMGVVDYFIKGSNGTLTDLAYRLIGAIGAITGGAATWLMLQALSEGLHILLDIEHNTRPASVTAKKNTG